MPTFFRSGVRPGRADLRDFGLSLLTGAALGLIAATPPALATLGIDPLYVALAAGALDQLRRTLTGPAR